MDNRFLSMLGICKKAGKISGGHDAAFESISKGKAAACFLCADASQRLKDEFMRTASFEGRNIPCIEIDGTMNDIWYAAKIRAAVFTVDDVGFAKKLIILADSRLKEDFNGN